MTKLILGLDSDALGKYHEVMTAKCLTGIAPERPKDQTGRIPDCKDSKSKYDTSNADNFLKSIIDHWGLTPEQQQVHDAKANSAASFLRNHFEQQGETIERVFWTSNPLDMQRLLKTNEKPKNTADIVVKTRKGNKSRMNGFSMKNFHKKRSNATHSNNGMKQLDIIFKADTTGIVKAAREEVLTNARRFGLDTSLGICKLHQLEKHHPELVMINQEVIKRGCIRMAGIYRDNLKDATEDEIKEVLLRVLSGELYQIPPMVLNSYGIDLFEHELQNHIGDVATVAYLHQGSLGVKEADNRTITITGQRGVSIAAIGIKGKSSGGFTQFCSRVNGIYNHAFVGYVE